MFNFLQLFVMQNFEELYEKLLCSDLEAFLFSKIVIFLILRPMFTNEIN